MSSSLALHPDACFSSPISPPSKISKTKIHHLLPYRDNRKIVKLKYRSPVIGNERKIDFNKFELKTQAGVRAMWNTYFCFETKVPHELEVTISRSIEDILKMLKRASGY